VPKLIWPCEPVDSSEEFCLTRLLVTASVVPSSPILVSLMKEALSSSETSVLTRATRRNIPEDTILHSHRRNNLKSYMLAVLLHSCSFRSIPPVFYDVRVPLQCDGGGTDLSL
jgi:hypothetical protein